MSCVLCEDGCQFCEPKIPEPYGTKYTARHRNHFQLQSVKKGLHPSGRPPYQLQSNVPMCKSCKWHQWGPPLPKSFGFCGMAVDEEHRKIPGSYSACAEFMRDPSK